MKAYSPNDIFNFALVGHGSDGKTTLAEAILFDAGAIDRQGRVEDKNTVMDYDPEETRRQISISMSLAAIEWDGKKVNLIDVPGYFDFEGEAVAAYGLADSSLIVLSARDEVPVGAEKAYAFCEAHNMPRAFIVNQIDKEHADFMKTLAALKAKYQTAVTPVQIPVVQGGKFTGIIDLVANQYVGFDGSTGPVPDAYADDAEEMRDALIENAAGNDDELMEKYFNDEALSEDEIKRGLRAGILQCSIAPVFAVAAAPNLGVRQMMNELVLLMPKASELPGKAAQDSSGSEVIVERDPTGPFAAQVMKSINDQYGKISLIKIYRGTLKNDSQVQNSRLNATEKTSNLGIMFGKKLVNSNQLQAGDIAALGKLDGTLTGDTLAAPQAGVVFTDLDFPEPSIALAITAKKQGTEDKVFGNLRRMEEEDRTFRIYTDKETGETLVSGLGEVHLDVMLNKLRNKYKAEGVLSEPRVPYRETIRASKEAEGKHKKQSGGAGQFGVVNIRFEPMVGSENSFEFVNNIVGGVVPKEFIPAVEKGLREAIQHGVLAGYPMVNIRATLFDGKYHPVDSKEVAFKSAARLAYKAACEAANPVLLEPIIKAEVLVPTDRQGDIIGDLTRRRGRVLGMNPAGDGLTLVEAEVPMSEMTKYATDLRSMTQGRGSFTTQFVRYEELPAQMASKVIEQAKKDMEGA